MKRHTGILISAIVILLASCGRTNHDDRDNVYAESTLQYSLDVALRRRESIVKPDYTMLASLADGRVPMRYGTLYRYMFPRRQPTYLAVDDAISDLWLFFELMQGAYGGYVAFGGDEEFIPIFEQIEAYILGQGSRSMSLFFGLDGIYISVASLKILIHHHLNDVITDRHFSIGDFAFGSTPYFMFASEDLTYDRRDNSFINKETGQYLVSVEGHELTEIMKQHMDEEGHLFYMPIFYIDMTKYFAELEEAYMSYIDGLDEEVLLNYLSQQELQQAPSITPVQINFVYEDEEIIRVFEEKRFHHHSYERQLPTLENRYGIPVISVMYMGFGYSARGFAYEHVQPFLSFVDYIREEPVVIVDLRGNIGGNARLPAMWIYELTGKIIYPNFVSLLAMEYTTHFPGDRPTSQKFQAARQPFENGYTISNTEPRKILEREQIIIVLTDTQTSSAAEIFVDIIFNISNTLVIGTPTSGTMTFDLTYPQLWLPHSGLSFGFGRTMHIWPEGHFAEGRGIEPDIWVWGDALAAALSLLRNAGIGDLD
ncbi:MAG: S41 family peptidase [Defluviitaleaceae bacterium]|nr:S41 family peptidase [Defluviitaleaceae bacterium]